MALPRKKKLGIKTTITAQRKFTDREPYQVSFQDALANVDTKDFNILIFYGVGGIGKSSLQEHLKKDHLDKDNNSVYSWLDFEEEQNRAPYKAFRILANNFKLKFKIPFSAFDIAYIIYWSKAFPEYEIKKNRLPFLEEGSLLSEIVDKFSDVGGMAEVVLGTLGYLYDKAKEFPFDSNVREELKVLNDLEPDAIEERLGEFFAYDIDKYKEKNPTKKVVIFLDTYEALWRNNKSDGNLYSKDEWIRNDLIGNLPNTLFVICGRELLRWDEYEILWKAILNSHQHRLPHLTQRDSNLFLISCNITDIDIQDNIYKASEGYPYYLDLSVDTFMEIEKSGKTPTAEDFSNLNKNSIFKTFMEFLNESETSMLYTLSHARFYTKEIFEILFGDRFSNSDLKRINNFSFISEDNGKYQMHNIMRESLLESPSNAEKEDANTKLFNHYNRHLQEFDIKNISQKSIDALSEAFYHKEQISNLTNLAIWYDDLYRKFLLVKKYQTLLEPTINLKDITEEKYDDLYRKFLLVKKDQTLLEPTINLKDITEEKYDDLSRKFLLVKKELDKTRMAMAVVYDKLAGLYNLMERYEDALPLYKKALSISREAFGEEHANTASCYNNLAVLYKNMDKYEEALSLYEKSLIIKEKVLPKEDPEIATTYINMASLHQSMKRYDEALLLYKKGITIFENKLGNEDLKTVIGYSQLASLYKVMEENEKALPLYEKALAIRRNVLGEENSDTATSYSKVGHTYYEMEEYDKALPQYEKALAIRRNVLGEENSDTATSYSNVGRTYYEMKEYKKALRLYEQALSIREKVLGKEDANTMRSYDDVASSFLNLKSFNDAVSYFEKYFKLFDIHTIEQSKDIPNFIYPYVKYYLVAVHTNDSKLCNELEVLAQGYIEYFKDKFKEDYSNQIDLDHEGYLSLRDSDDSLDNQKYDLFVKIFMS